MTGIYLYQHVDSIMFFVFIFTARSVYSLSLETFFILLFIYNLKLSYVFYILQCGP